MEAIDLAVIKQQAKDLQTLTDCKLCHAYEAIARARGFRTYAALRAEWKRQQEGIAADA